MAAMGEAPPMLGEDPEEVVEIEGVSGDTYGSVAAKRAADRKARESAEDRREDHKPTFIQPQKEKRFKVARPLWGEDVEGQQQIVIVILSAAFALILRIIRIMCVCVCDSSVEKQHSLRKQTTTLAFNLLQIEGAAFGCLCCW